MQIREVFSFFFNLILLTEIFGSSISVCRTVSGFQIDRPLLQFQRQKVKSIVFLKSECKLKVNHTFTYYFMT